jgi:hypothetical protein
MPDGLLDLSLGQNIKKCADFMIFVMKQTQRLFLDLEELLEAEGGPWKPIGETMVFSSYTATLESLDRRFPASLGKLYSPSRDDEHSRVVAAMEAHFSPSCGAEEALLVLGHARFPRPISYTDALNDYDSGSFVESLYGKEPPPYGEERHFESGFHPGVFSGAASVRATAWPLAQITRETLQTTVLQTLRQVHVTLRR